LPRSRRPADSSNTRSGDRKLAPTDRVPECADRRAPNGDGGAGSEWTGRECMARPRASGKTCARSVKARLAVFPSDVARSTSGRRCGAASSNEPGGVGGVGRARGENVAPWSRRS
jgi:hypothetical protein